MDILNKLAGVFTGPLTKPGLYDPTTGQTQYYNSPEEAQAARDAIVQSNSDIASEADRRMLAQPPSPLAPADGAPADSSFLSTLNQQQPAQNGNLVESPQSQGQTAPDGSMIDYLAGNVRPGPLPAQKTVPTFQKAPTFQQASTDPRTGMPAPLNPAETKLGKFLSILHGAVQGGLAGQAAAEQSVIASGGHRSAGFGTGYMAGQAAPYQQAAMRQQVQQGALRQQMEENQMRQMNTPVTLPDGRVVPFWQADQESKIANMQRVPVRLPSGETIYVSQKDMGKYAGAVIGADSKDKATNQRRDAAAQRYEAQLAGMGLKLDDDGNMKAMDDSELPPKLVSDIEFKKTRQGYIDAQTELANANTELAKAKNDPNSPAFKLAFQRQQVAQQNASAAGVRAQAYMGNYLQHAYNTGLNGEVLPGAPVISNDTGQQSVVGSVNASNAIGNQANAAQFNDVYGATDHIENSARALVRANGKGALNDARVAAALADPETTSSQWAQGMFANSGLTPQQRDYVIAVKAYGENLQALRKSAGGSVSDTQVDRLMQLAPGAATPDLDYLLRQTSQIRSLADRLGKGATVAVGGLSVRGQGNANQTPAFLKRGAKKPAPAPAKKPAGNVEQGPGYTIFTNTH